MSRPGAFSDQKGYAFNGYAVSTEGGTVLIDPPNPGEDGWPTVDQFEPCAGVWLTNRNHTRAAAVFRERYGLTVWAHEADADRLEAGADRVVAGNMTIAGVIEIVPVPGKSPGEIAFHLPRSGALIVGDLVIGVPPGELSTYPDEVIDDRQSSTARRRGGSTTTSTRCCSATASRCPPAGTTSCGSSWRALAADSVGPDRSSRLPERASGPPTPCRGPASGITRGDAFQEVSAWS